MCFERAGDKHWETFAKAAGMESSAARAQNHEEAFKILRQAGELFESINEHKRAADCYYESKNYDKAGMPFAMCLSPKMFGYFFPPRLYIGNWKRHLSIFW